MERTLFLGNVPLTLKPKKIRSLVAPFGAVESVRLRSVPVAAEGKMPRGGKVITGALAAHATSAHAYIVFADARSVADAIAAINMKKIDGRHLVANAATRPSTRSKGRGVDEQSAETTELPSRATSRTTARAAREPPVRRGRGGRLAFFAECKEKLKRAVEAVRVVRDRATNAGKGIAFVLFREAKHARTGLLLDGAKMKTKGGGGARARRRRRRRGRGRRRVGAGGGSSDASQRRVDFASSRERDAERRAAIGGAARGERAASPGRGAEAETGRLGARGRGRGGRGPSGARGSVRGERRRGEQARLQGGGAAGGAKRPAVAARKAKAKARPRGRGRR